MPDPAATYTSRNRVMPSDIDALAAALALLCPGSHVGRSLSSPGVVGWITLPSTAGRRVLITSGPEGWAAAETGASADPLKISAIHAHLDHANRLDLIAVIHDAFAYIHGRTHTRSLT